MNKKPIFTFGKDINPKKMKINNNHFLIDRPLCEYTDEQSELNIENMMIVDKAFLKPEQVDQILAWANENRLNSAWDLWEQYYMEGGV